MAKSKKKKVAKELPILDPILPIAAGNEWPGVKQGESKEIMANDHLVVVELPYRALFGLWEHAERVAARDYPKYIIQPSMRNHAVADLEAVHAIRQAVSGATIPVFDEDEAQKIRKAIDDREKAKKAADKERMAAAREAKKVAACPHTSLKKTKRGDQKYVKCLDCGSSWEREGAPVPQEALDALYKRKSPAKPSAPPKTASRASTGKKAKNRSKT